MARRPTVRELMEAGRLESMAPDETEARDLLAHAKAHLESARAISATDPAGAYQLAYDAARKAAAAVMAADGVRTKSNQPGAHAAVVLYAEEVLGGHADEEALGAFDQMRRSRNRAEYGGVTVGADQLAADIEHAKSLVDAVERLLG